jgi:hypothetical protein
MTFFQHHSFAGNSEEMTLTADLQQTNDVTNMILWSNIWRINNMEQNKSSSTILTFSHRDVDASYNQ